MSKYKSKREKLEAQLYSDLGDMPQNLLGRYPTGKLYIPTGPDVELAIRDIPVGAVKKSTQIRDEIALKHGGATSCAMVFGILWRIVAEAAEEDRDLKCGEPAPYWRVVRDDGTMNEKLPGGIERHIALLESEGHKIGAIGKSKKPRLAI